VTSPLPRDFFGYLGGEKATLLIFDNNTYAMYVKSENFDCGYDGFTFGVVSDDTEFEEPIPGTLRCKEDSSSSGLETWEIILIVVGAIVGITGVGIIVKRQMAGKLAFDSENLM